MIKIEKPIFIIGAPRCGKKMTAEVLARDPSVYAFQYEMNFLWRYGHASFPHDQLTPPMLSGYIQSYIQRRFSDYLMANGKLRIVDRTDHNVVRADYVDGVFPDGLFILVVREPRAAIASAIKRRQEKVGMLPYLKKSLTVPARDLVYYSIRYLKDIFQARFAQGGYKNLWGIRTPGTLRLDPKSSLAEKCALQWRECVEAGLEFSKVFPPDRFLIVHYERLVKNPKEEFKKIFEFSKLFWSPDIEEWVDQNIHSASLDKWKEQLTADDLSQVESYTRDLAGRLGC